MKRPEYLYKYRSIDGNRAGMLRNIVTQNEMFFSAPERFNDPFDCAPPVLQTSVTDDEFLGFVRSAYSSPGGTLNDLLTRVREKWSTESLRCSLLTEVWNEMQEWMSKRMGVLSLSAVPDNILMWSHYADSHQGVCLRFRGDLGYFARALPVLYSEERVSVSPVKIFNDDGMIVAASLLQKASAWSYEEEWRVLEQKTGSGLYGFPPDALDGIILGAKTSPEHIALVADWVRTRPFPVKLLRAEIDS